MMSKKRNRPKRMRLAILLITVFLTAVVATACSGSPQPNKNETGSSSGAGAKSSPGPQTNTSPAKSEPAQLSKVTLVATNYSTMFENLAVHVGIAEGIFERAGLEVDAVEGKGGGDIVRAVTLGDMNFGGAAVPAVVTANLQGEPVKIVATFYGASSIFWLVKTDSPITSIKQLKGKKIGYSKPGSNTNNQAKTIIMTAGLSLDDVELIPVGGAAEAMTALLTGVVDVVYSVDILAIKNVKEGKARILWDAAVEIPYYADMILTTTEKFTKENPKVVRSFIAAIQESMDFIKGNPQKAAVVGARDHKISEDLALEILKTIPAKAWSTKIDPTTIDALEAEMLENGILKEKPPWDKIIDRSFLP